LPEPQEPPDPRQPNILGPDLPHQPTLRTDPGKPNYPRRGIPSGLAQIGMGGGLWLGGHPLLGPGLIGSGLRSIIGRTGGEEGSLEAFIRRRLQNRPRVQRGARTVAASTADEARKNVPTPKDVAKGIAKVPQYLKYAWPGGSQ
jgi:hypothetical protein